MRSIAAGAPKDGSPSRPRRCSRPSIHRKSAQSASRRAIGGCSPPHPRPTGRLAREGAGRPPPGAFADARHPGIFCRRGEGRASAHTCGGAHTNVCTRRSHPCAAWAPPRMTQARLVRDGRHGLQRPRLGAEGGSRNDFASGAQGHKRAHARQLNARKRRVSCHPWRRRAGDLAPRRRDRPDRTIYRNRARRRGCHREISLERKCAPSTAGR